MRNKLCRLGALEAVKKAYDEAAKKACDEATKK